MTSFSEPSKDLMDELLLTVGDSLFDTTSPDDMAKLERLVCTDERACDLYVQAIFDSLTLRKWAGVIQEDVTTAEHLEASDALPAPPISYVSVGLPDAVAFTSAGYLSSGWPVAYLVAAVIVGLGLVVGAVTHVSQPESYVGPSLRTPIPQSPTPNPSSIVGRITGLVDCKWDQDKAQGSRFKVQGSVALGQQFALASGLMEITYDTGAKVILQGPVTYQVETNGGYLAIGKLTGKLEKKVVSGRWPVASESNPQSLIPNPFAIRTPTAVVTDLGTEFGVEVEETGATRSHVFRGSVQLQARAANGVARGNVTVLHMNESARVEANGDSPTTVVASAEPAGFVRALSKRSFTSLSLTDIVAGGDGFAGMKSGGINPCSGQVVDCLPGSTEALYLVGDGVYHPVSDLPFVDGVFIPNGGKGPAQVDSAGHAFAGFPSTDNRTYGYVWAGNVKASSYPASNRLGRIDYDLPGHSQLDMLANKGVTFNLGAIRRANPDCKLLRFCAVVGNASPASVQKTYEAAGAWVLVDGKAKFVRQELRGWTAPISVAVPISDQDQFLTLATTDGGDGHAWDWIVFGDPRIEMQAASDASDRPIPPQTPTRTSRKAIPPHKPQSNQMVFNANAALSANQVSGVPASQCDAWSVGYRRQDDGNGGLLGTRLRSFTGDQHLPCDDSPIRGWELPLVSLGIAINTSDRDYPNMNGVVYEKNTICMHPGNDGSYAVVRWKAPRDGVVKTSTIFSAIHEPVTDVHVLLVHKGVVKSIFDGEINARTDPKTIRLDASQSAIAVSEGDYLETIVGWGADQSNSGDATGLLHSIEYLQK